MKPLISILLSLSLGFGMAYGAMGERCGNSVQQPVEKCGAGKCGDNRIKPKTAPGKCGEGKYNQAEPMQSPAEKCNSGKADPKPAEKCNSGKAAPSPKSGMGM